MKNLIKGNFNNKTTRSNTIDKIAIKLWPPKMDDSNYWQLECRILFNSLSLMLLDLDNKRFTFSEVNRIIITESDFSGYLKTTLNALGDDLDPITVQGFKRMLQKSKKEQASVLATLKSGLPLNNDAIVNPLIDLEKRK